MRQHKSRTKRKNLLRSDLVCVLVRRMQKQTIAFRLQDKSHERLAKLLTRFGGGAKASVVYRHIFDLGMDAAEIGDDLGVEMDAPEQDVQANG